MTRTTVYRCYHCTYILRGICNIGPMRRMWCGRCGCNRPFLRAAPREQLRAWTWPPAAREGAP